MSEKKSAAGALADRLGWIAVLLLIAGFVFHAYQLQYTQDDAYISLRYAKHLVAGEGLVFNPGERTEGYSNFTWTMLLALFLKLGAPPIETSRWLGVFFGAAAIFVAARFARALEGRVGPATLGTAALVAGNSAYALWSTGGLETALFGLLVTWGLERGFAPGVSDRGRMAAPVLLCLAALTRPDGPLLFAGYFGFRVLDTMFGGPGRQASGWRSVARDFALFVGPLVLPTLWALFSKRVGLSAVFITALVGGGVAALVKWVFNDIPLIAENPRDVEVIVGIVPPLLTLVLIELLSRKTHPNVDRVEALAAKHLAEQKVSSEMPRRAIAWSCLSLAIVLAGLTALQNEDRGYLVAGTVVLLLISAGMLLPGLSRKRS